MRRARVDSFGSARPVTGVRLVSVLDIAFDFGVDLDCRVDFDFGVDFDLDFDATLCFSCDRVLGGVGKGVSGS